ncbi:YceI family protein [Brevibacterium sp. UMB1308A]|uniref:YceI family protein n=1 Tax=Brevibacterium sp. UMB1308A TaxID=3050608 RepID=UPI002550EC00|nr:YceI family protein [Brevibacterium sp. UMB1308A]MDK8346765.1 YceI family protein [Brevibacterium sp. UMB1308B]MDK8714105.1 YceI family protein [Brevibacterium sp. UMB1308A]
MGSTPEHLKSGDFFQTEEHPEIVFKSTNVEDFDGSDFTLKGEVTLLGVTKEVVFDAEFLGANEDPNGNQITGVSATAKINRKDFGMSFSATMPGGDLLVADKVNLEIDVELVKA